MKEYEIKVSFISSFTTTDEEIKDMGYDSVQEYAESMADELPMYGSEPQIDIEEEEGR